MAKIMIYMKGGGIFAVNTIIISGKSLKEAFSRVQFIPIQVKIYLQIYIKIIFQNLEGVGSFFQILYVRIKTI